MLVIVGKFIKILFNILSNIFRNIKYSIKEKKSQKQYELRQHEIQRQENLWQEGKFKQELQEELKQEIEKQEANMKEEKTRQQNTSFCNSYREGLDIDYINKLRQQKNYYRQGLDIDYINKLKHQNNFYEDESNIEYVEKKGQSSASFHSPYKEGLNIEEMQMSYIDRLNNGYEFEEYTASLLKELGFYNIEVTQSSGDYGADVLAEKDGATYAIQCKWSSFGNNNIGSKAVQEVYSGKAFYNKDIRCSYNKQFLYSFGNRICRQNWC